MYYAFVIAIVQLGLLIFAPAYIVGMLHGLLVKERGARRARWPGFAWYGVIEIAVFVDKGFPFLWGNLAQMVPIKTPPVWLSLIVGVAGGVLMALEAGSVSKKGYRLASRIAGFSIDPDRKPETDSETQATEPRDAQAATAPTRRRKRKKKR